MAMKAYLAVICCKVLARQLAQKEAMCVNASKHDTCILLRAALIRPSWYMSCVLESLEHRAKHSEH